MPIPVGTDSHLLTVQFGAEVMTRPEVDFTDVADGDSALPQLIGQVLCDCLALKERIVGLPWKANGLKRGVYRTVATEAKSAGGSRHHAGRQCQAAHSAGGDFINADTKRHQRVRNGPRGVLLRLTSGRG